MALSVEHPTGSGHDLTVCEFEPRIRLAAISLSAQGPLWIVCPPLSLPLPRSHSFSLSLSLSQKINTIFKKIINTHLE